MTRLMIAGAVLVTLLQNAVAADLPVSLPNPPRAYVPNEPPYSREAALKYCELALMHPPFAEVPFAKPWSKWMIDCADQFSEPRNAAKRAESLICEARATDLLAEAKRNKIARFLPPLKSFLLRCENIFRTEAMHLPPLAPAPAEPVPHRDARFLSP